MAKPKQKAKKPPKNRAAQARISFLFQAAEYLSSQLESAEDSATHRDGRAEATTSANSPTNHGTANHHESTNEVSCDTTVLKRHALPAYFASHMFSVRQKSQGKVEKELKRRICKRCKCFLIDGRTSSTAVENKSKSKKPWADVTVVSCLACGMEKRYPVGVKKSSKVSADQEREVSP
jgi:ribonuclease P protein subunit RPR2